MDNPDPEGASMKCSIRECGGQYEDRTIVHAVTHRGRITVIDGVPAEVCRVCGDVLLRPETVRRIEHPRHIRGTGTNRAGLRVRLSVKTHETRLLAASR